MLVGYRREILESLDEINNYGPRSKIEKMCGILLKNSFLFDCRYLNAAGTNVTGNLKIPVICWSIVCQMVWDVSTNISLI